VVLPMLGVPSQTNTSPVGEPAPWIRLPAYAAIWRMPNIDSRDSWVRLTPRAESCLSVGGRPAGSSGLGASTTDACNGDLSHRPPSACLAVKLAKRRSLQVGVQITGGGGHLVPAVQASSRPAVLARAVAARSRNGNHAGTATDDFDLGRVIPAFCPSASLPRAQSSATLGSRKSPLPALHVFRPQQNPPSPAPRPAPRVSQPAGGALPTAEWSLPLALGAQRPLHQLQA